MILPSLRYPKMWGYSFLLLLPQLCCDQQGLAVIRHYFLLMFDWWELKYHKNRVAALVV